VRRRPKSDPIGGNISGVGPRFIAMVGVAGLCAVAVRYWLPPYSVWSVLCVVVSAVLMIILFAGNERQVRPLSFVFRPLIRLIKWLGPLIEAICLSLWIFR